MKPDVLCIGSFPEVTIEAMYQEYTVHHFHDLPVTADAFADGLADRIRAISTEANRGVSREAMELFPNLEIIAVFGVGTDAIDLERARERSISVVNTPDIIGPEVADLAVGLMLASARQIIVADRYVRDGEWIARGPIGLGRSVNSKICGILGLGSIGRAVAERAVSFQMRVIYHGPCSKAGIPYEYVADPLELALRSDYLIVACKGGQETRHLVSRAVLDALGPNGTLINVARSTVVDERAMIDSLKSGRLGFAALDVFDGEPNISQELLTLPNVIVQPHHGSATIETRSQMGKTILAKLSAHFGSSDDAGQNSSPG